MKVNGKDISIKNNKSLFTFLQDNNYDLKKIAVECNGHIVPRATYGEVILSDEDSLEIVCFVGGG